EPSAAPEPATAPTNDAPATPSATSGVAELVPIDGVAIGRALIAVWATGIVILSAYTLARWLLLMRLLRITRQPISDDLAEQFQAVARQLGLRRRPRLTLSSEPLGPAAFGWWPGTVILPQSLAAKSPAELAPILAHELTHLRRFDTVAGSLQLA